MSASIRNTGGRGEETDLLFTFYSYLPIQREYAQVLIKIPD
jgi:hypothetical protein